MTTPRHSSFLARTLPDDRTFALIIGGALGLQLAGYAAVYALNVLLARLLGAHGYGEYSFVSNWIHILAFVGSLGFQFSALRTIPAYAPQGQAGLVRGFVGLAWRAALIGSALAGAGAIAVMARLPLDDLRFTVIALGLLITPLVAGQQLAISLLRGFGEVFWAFAPVELIRPLVIIAAALLVAVFWGLSDSLVALGLFAGAGLAVLALQAALLRRHLRRMISPAPPQTLPREWLALSANLLTMNAAMLFMQRTPTILLGFLQGGASVGLYYAAERIASLALVLMLAAGRVFHPMIAPLYQAGRLDELQRRFVILTRWTFWTTLILSAGLILLSEWLLRLFGAEFVEAAAALRILIATQVLSSATGHTVSLLNYTRYERATRRVGLLLLALTVALNAILIPAYGVIGAALAMAAVQTAQNLIFLVLVRRYLGLRLPLSTYLPRLTGWRGQWPGGW